jgi:hypothetical protein
MVERVLILFVVIGGTTISAWIVALRMRRRIRRALGRKATDAELTSISTWMKVKEEEERTAKYKPLE